jgi:hypothetical protein
LLLLYIKDILGICGKRLGQLAGLLDQVVTFTLHFIYHCISMKKFFLLASLAVSTQAAQAQTTESTPSRGIAAGTVSLGGNIGYSKTTDKTTNPANNVITTIERTSSQFSFSPAVGFFVADNLALGLNIGYTSVRRPYTNRTPGPNGNRPELDPTTTLRFGPYVQYYRMVTEQFGVVGTLSGGYQNRRAFEYANSSTNAIAEFKSSGFYAALTPGVIFFPIPKFGISASIGSLGYERLNNDYPTNSGTTPNGFESTSSSFGADFGIRQLMFGGTLFLGR